MSDGASVGTVKGTVELEDRMSSAIDLLEHKIESLDAKFGGLGSQIAKQATSFFTAEAALEGLKEIAHLAADTLKEITIEGSHAADIEGTFHHLTESAGLLGDTLLEKTREGLHGTVTDMDIMTRVNQNLAVGLNLTAEQMATLSKGAFALAKATGGNVAEAMDKLSDAMVTGRTRSVAMLTGKISLTDAEEKYAEKLHTTADHLTQEGKMHAAQEIILERVAAATDRVGETQVRLADKIQQVKVEFANFEEELGTAVATSPVVAAGFDGIREALEGAFGSNQAETVRTLAHMIDDFAIRLIDMAEGGVNAAAILGQEWNAAKVVFGDILQVVDGDILVFKYLAEGIAEVGKALHIPGAAEEVNRIDGEIQNLMQSMVERGKALQEDKKAEDDWAVSSGKVIDVLEGIKAKMISAKENEGEYTDVIRDNKTAHDEAGASTEKHGAAEGALALTLDLTKEELKKYNQSWKELNSVGESWEQTLSTLNPSMVKMIQYYLDAGASVEQLAGAFPNLTKNEIEAVKHLQEHAKVEAEAASSLIKLYIEYYNKKTELYGTDSQKSIAAAEKDYEIRVEELQKKGVKDVEYYNELWDLRNKDIALDEGQRLLTDTHSKASLDKRILDAKDYFQFMMDHRDQYTQKDVDAQRGEVQRLQETRRHWGELGEGIDGAADQVHLLDHAWVTDGDIAASTINKTTVMVKTLSGEVISLMEAQRRQQTGGSFDVTSQNFQQTIQTMASAGGSNIDVNRAYQLAHQGYSLQEIVDIFSRMKTGNNGPIPPPHGPRIPGFKDGGVGDFGDGTLAVLHGPEAIIPLDKAAGGIGTTNLNFYVNGTGAQVAQEVKNIIMRELKSVRTFGAA